MIEEQNCGHCRHYRMTIHWKKTDTGREPKTEWFCDCDESVFDCEPRDYGDSCGEWTERI